MVRRHQIVEAIPAEGESPVVLFDFDHWFTLGVGTDFSPPEVRVSSTWTQLQDGETTGASTLGDRTIRLVLTQFRGNAEDQAEVLQTLGRLLDDSRGQWFLWQDEGTVHERFFRTKRAPMSVEDHYLLENPKRTVTLTIPALPAAYGRKIEDTAIIANDVTAATNPMSYLFPPIKGDLPTPLWFEWEYVLSSGNFEVRAAVAASSGDVLPDTPTYVIANTQLDDTAVGWTSADQADATFFNGERRRSTKSSGTETTRVISGAELPFVPGDYRVLVRAKAPPGATFHLTTGFVSGYTILDYEVPASSTSELTWFDMGVMRMPIDQPLVDPVFGLVPVLESAFSLEVGLSTSSGVIDTDTVLFIPVGLDEGVASSYAGCAPPFASSGFTYLATLDGVNELAYSRIDPFVGGSITVDGGFPSVTPGVKNVLYLVPYVFADDAFGEPDSKTRMVDISYAYYPRYLYLRSATG